MIFQIRLCNAEGLKEGDYVQTEDGKGTVTRLWASEVKVLLDGKGYKEKWFFPGKLKKLRKPNPERGMYSK